MTVPAAIDHRFQYTARLKAGQPFLDVGDPSDLIEFLSARYSGLNTEQHAPQPSEPRLVQHSVQSELSELPQGGRARLFVGAKHERQDLDPFGPHSVEHSGDETYVFVTKRQLESLKAGEIFES